MIKPIIAAALIAGSLFAVPARADNTSAYCQAALAMFADGWKAQRNGTRIAQELSNEVQGVDDIIANAGEHYTGTDGRADIMFSLGAVWGTGYAESILSTNTPFSQVATNFLTTLGCGTRD